MNPTRYLVPSGSDAGELKVGLRGEPRARGRGPDGDEGDGLARTWARSRFVRDLMDVSSGISLDD
jgi:hypothetical protein